MRQFAKLLVFKSSTFVNQLDPPGASWREGFSRQKSSKQIGNHHRLADPTDFFDRASLSPSLSLSRLRHGRYPLAACFVDKGFDSTGFRPQITRQ